jgi:hypothetical protein
MNFEFPFKELPAVMRGPRVEHRRVLIGGSAFWGTMEGEATRRLDDGRQVDAAAARYGPPVSPSKIVAVHLAHGSRSIEARNRPKPTCTPTHFTEPPTSLNGHGGQILKPADCRHLDHEGEHAVVIGRGTAGRVATAQETTSHGAVGSSLHFGAPAADDLPGAAEHDPASRPRPVVLGAVARGGCRPGSCRERRPAAPGAGGGHRHRGRPRGAAFGRA